LRLSYLVYFEIGQSLEWSIVRGQGTARGLLDHRVS
jgi:hypothetical protein